MAFEKKVALKGSDKLLIPGSVETGKPDRMEKIDVTVVLRGKDHRPQPGRVRCIARHEYDALYGPEENHLELLRRFAADHNLAVGAHRHGSRNVKLTGTVAAVEDAFGVNLLQYRVNHRNLRYRGRQGAVQIPEELESFVVAVLGLDDRPQAKPHLRFRGGLPQSLPAGASNPNAAAPGSFNPNDVAKLYQFPQGDGSGQTVGIIELGGGFSASDLKAYFSGLGISQPKVTAVAVDNGTNAPGKDPNADGEVMLDIEVAGAVAPGANIVVYFAENTDQGFTNAISQAVHDATNKPSVISISWGGPEDTWTQQSRDAMNMALQDAATVGVTVTVAAGDDGATDGLQPGQGITGTYHVDFPGSSPWSLCCGGTKLSGSGTISSEIVWDELSKNEGATGGGVSRTFPLPDYQSKVNVPKNPDTGFVGRGVPDLAGDADPETGYNVLVDGRKQVIGGTSAVAPLAAGLIAILNQQLKTQLGFVNPDLYQATSGFRDITSGNNGYYKAGAGWDPCTGLGSPVGTALQSGLQAIIKANPPAQPSGSDGSAKPTQNPPKKNPTKKPVKVH
jgi:kumamolisin